MRKKIALDVDEVIADPIPKFLDAYEHFFGKRLKKEDYWGRKVYDLPNARHIRDVLYDKGFFRDLPVMANSQEIVQELAKKYDIYFTTSTMEFRNSLEDKYDWLVDHFPFIPSKQFVFVGDKSIIQADYMIDDHASNLIKFSGKRLLYTASYNIKETRFTRVNDWLEIRAFFENEK